MSKVKNFKQFVNENYDLVSQFKGDHHGNPTGKNEYLNSLGLDEDGIKTLEIWINIMKNDENWIKQTYPNGADKSLLQSTDLLFYTTPPNTPNVDDSIERLRISDTGNVGIATASPLSLFCLK